MHKFNLRDLLRSVSIIIILLLVFFYIGLTVLLDDIVLESSISQPRKEYEYIGSAKDPGIPEFTYTLESLFPKQPVPVVVPTKLDSKPVNPVNIPLLQFVGMIETDNKIIYSFRNIHTNKLMLFEEGVVLEGTMLIAVETSKYTFRKNEITFQVDKK